MHTPPMPNDHPWSVASEPTSLLAPAELLMKFKEYLSFSQSRDMYKYKTVCSFDGNAYVLAAICPRDYIIKADTLHDSVCHNMLKS